MGRRHREVGKEGTYALTPKSCQGVFERRAHVHFFEVGHGAVLGRVGGERRFEAWRAVGSRPHFHYARERMVGQRRLAGARVGSVTADSPLTISTTIWSAIRKGRNFCRFDRDIMRDIRHDIPD